MRLIFDKYNNFIFTILKINNQNLNKKIKNMKFEKINWI